MNARSSIFTRLARLRLLMCQRRLSKSSLRNATPGRFVGVPNVIFLDENQIKELADMQEKALSQLSIDKRNMSNMDNESSFDSDEDEESKRVIEEPHTADVKAEKPLEIQPDPKKPAISDYEVLGKLGEGAFGEVHHVVRKSDGLQFALKVLSKKNVTKKVHQEIQRERALLMQCDHPNIVKLHQCFHDPKNLYFVMEYVPNGELFTYMTNEGVLKYEVAQFLTAEMVSVIAYLQEQMLCHRDIKPGNIMFDTNMHLKIIDFGSGKSYKDMEVQKVSEDDKQSGSDDNKEIKRMNTFCGTYEYMAPEIIKGQYVSNACDLWAIGIIVYKFFAEFPPFVGSFPEETLIKIQEEDVKFPENFPEAAADLV